jgi:pyruvoyl-dependent arginine decarboxylase (PvlArgDC)
MRTNRIWGTSGAGEGASPLEAFDAALCHAGLSEVNLTHVSGGVFPPGTYYANDGDSWNAPNLQAGSTYSAVVSSYRSRTMPIVACIGFTMLPNGSGVVAGFSNCSDDADLAERRVRAGIASALARRGWRSPTHPGPGPTLFTAKVSRPFTLDYHAAVAAVLFLP